MKLNEKNKLISSVFLFLLFFSGTSFSELQFHIASRHAAAIAAVAAAALPPPPSSSTNPNSVSLGNSASGLGGAVPPVVPSSHQHEFHPAYRIPYMEHLYSLQHASAASASSSLHGKFIIRYQIHFFSSFL